MSRGVYDERRGTSFLGRRPAGVQPNLQERQRKGIYWSYRQIRKEKRLQEHPPVIIMEKRSVIMGKNKKNQKKKSKATDVLLTLVLILAIGIFCYAAYNLYHIYTEYKKGTDEYNKIQQMAVTEKAPDSVQQQEETPDTLTPPIEVDFAALKGVNEDVVGWIYIEALEGVSYPVVHGTDNEEYLHTTYEGNYNFAGTIFVDYENKGDFSDCNTLVYGHNMKNGSMFGNLKDFVQKEDTYQKSKYFWILTPRNNYRYEIISAYTTSVSSDTYTLFKGPGEDFRQYLNKIVSYSEIATTPGELTLQDRIVTLSTCTGNEATRFVVQGKLVDALPASQG